MKKVYITGTGLVTSLGQTIEEVFSALLENKSAVQHSPEWPQYNGLHSHLFAPIENFSAKNKIPRSVRRTMSNMSEYAAVAAQDALAQAGLRIEDLSPEESQRSIVLMGSTTGSPVTYEEFFKKAIERGGPEGQMGTSFFKVMNHSVAANVAAALNFAGPYQGVSCACASSAQAIIMGWELIQSGLYDRVVCGGGDELHYTSTAVFDIVLAASRNFNDQPEKSPRPFDQDRDGLVASEGGATLVLESEESLRKRGGREIAQLLGGSYRGSGAHMSQSDTDSMLRVVSEALNRAQIKPEKVDYINAHATGTLQGDAAEAQALARCFGDQVPVSSLKAHFGHSLAPCGAIEAIVSIKMMEKNLLIGTRNLQKIAEDCQGIHLFTGNLEKETNCILSTNFAFGGMNTALLISKHQT